MSSVVISSDLTHYYAFYTNVKNVFYGHYKNVFYSHLKFSKLNIMFFL